MKNTAQHKVFDEEESLVPTDVQVISRCRRITLPFVPQENRLHHGDAEDETSRTFDTPPVVYNPTPLRWCCPPESDFNDLAVAVIPPVLGDHDEVDTTLRLSNYAPRNSKIQKRMNNPTPDRFRADFFNGVEEDEVDTTLNLRPPATTNHIKSRTEAKGKRKANPIKSRMQAKGKRKADADVNAVDKRKRSSNRNRNRDDEDQRPLLPIEQIPTLMNAIESRNGSTPIFLFRKKLEESDVWRYQNRLFVTRSERMMGFLSKAEAAVVYGDGKGLKMGGVDGGGNEYDNFGLNKWASLKMIVINSDWRKLVDANNAMQGDVVEIWGFRVDEKPCLAFNFRRDNAGCSSTSTSSTDEGTSQIKFN